MAGVSGKGISAAVRGSVREWMTEHTINAIFNEYERINYAPGLRLTLSDFTRRIRSAEDWVRTTRTKRYPSGWNRDYYSKQFSGRTRTDGVRIEIVTNADDTQITYVRIFVKTQLVGGGEVKVPSVLVSQRGRNASLNLQPTFRAFTLDELTRMQSEYENSGDIALFAEERDV